MAPILLPSGVEDKPAEGDPQWSHDKETSLLDSHLRYLSECPKGEQHECPQYVLGEFPSEGTQSCK